MLPFLVAGLIIAILAILAVAAVSSLIIICPPNRVAVISGRDRVLPDGRRVGYRVIKGGRTLRIPILETVSWIDLSTMPIEVEVENAFSAGAIPLNVQGIANIKVSSVEGLLENSVERFLDTSQEQIAAIAKDTLEANLRGVLATLTPEEVNEDRLKFSQTLIEEADDDVRKLGLTLDTLKIQNVNDDVSYLDSVGRRRTAEVIKEARVAEAERTAESEEAEATGRQRAEIAKAHADKQIVEQQNDLRVRTAELEGLARATEAEATVAGEKARVVAEQQLERERVVLENTRLEADIVAPAKANLESQQLMAKAEAAKIIEDGAAQVEVFRRLSEQYAVAGDDAQEIMVLNMLPSLIEQIVSTVDGIDIDRVAVVDSGGGDGVSKVVNQMPNAVISLTEQIQAATGIDILGAMRDRAIQGNGVIDAREAFDANSGDADGANPDAPPSPPEGTDPIA